MAQVKRKAWFPGGGVFSNGAVQDSAELQRIIRLARRIHDEEFAARQVALFQGALAKPGGRMTLRPIQALALHDMAFVGGLLAPIGVGWGKTLIVLLAPRVLGARRPLIIIPASLKEKTFDDMAILSKHFYLPHYIRVESYEFLSRVGGAGLLEQYAPDAIICDEAHRLKNPSAAVTKRVRRYLQEAHEKHEENPAIPIPKFVAVSGTLTKRSIKDYAHLSAWALGDLSPVPRKFPVLMEWCSALDQNNSMNVLGYGALEQLAHDEPVVCQDSARRAFRDRLVQTPGVVATIEGALDVSLEIDAMVIDAPPEVDANMEELRSMWLLPDGHEMIDGVEKWRHAREMALGFYYKWDPWPPDEWAIPRAIWGSKMREVLKNNRRHIDTDLQLRNAIEEHPEWYPDAAEAYGNWLKVKDTFTPNTVPVFFSDHLIREAEKWAHKNRGIVWIEHQAFGKRFEDLTGIPCYGESGLDRRGNRIEHHPSGTALAARIASNCTGRNLQAWYQNLFVSPMPSGLTTEQTLGRTHRPGQLADTVYATWMLSCVEHLDAFQRCLDDAAYVQDSQGVSQKILYADVTFDIATIAAGRTSATWVK